MKTKLFIRIALLASLVVGMTACGKSKEEQAMEDANKMAAEARKVADEAAKQAQSEMGKAMEQVKEVTGQANEAAKQQADMAAQMMADAQKAATPAAQ